MRKRLENLSIISSLHYFKLLFRTALFVLVFIMYIYSRTHNPGVAFKLSIREHWVLGLVWIIYAIEMAFRFFPSRFESMGNQKQFKRNYRPIAGSEVTLQSWQKTLAVVGVWIALNAIIGALYFTHLIDRGILVLVSLAYGVCDVICILFFCPFQTWIMKNRCCGTCRIYNWDFAMMFTPFILIPHWYTWSLFAMSLLLIIKWEITAYRHPEYFSEASNASLTCTNCEEKLCSHKKQLLNLWEKISELQLKK